MKKQNENKEIQTKSLKNRQSINYKIAMTGIFGALSIILALTPIGYIQVGALAITIMHIPTILATLIGGLVPGLFTGLIFGISSLVKAATSGNASNIFFVNPLVSVLPRVLFPIAVWGFFKLLNLIPRMPKTISGGIAAAAGTLVHTLLVLGALVIFYGKDLGLKSGEMLNGFFAFVAATLATNGLWEIVSATVLSVIVLGAIYGINSHKSKISKLEDDSADADSDSNANA